jgi:hypothetical protein
MRQRVEKAGVKSKSARLPYKGNPALSTKNNG